MINIIDNIKKILIEKGISHEAMAMNLGISQAAYTKVEKSKTKLTVDRLFKIAEILNVKVEDLLDIQIDKVYRQEFKDHTVNYQEFHNLYQENKEVYRKLIQSKDEQITLLRNMLNKE
ncbi:transcriptional regulator [Elizabethkingia anophelis]|nr:transcriptional regulator [Elizabethkingia anophelis]